MDEIKSRRAENLGADGKLEENDVVRAGHGDGGSLRAMKFREMHRLDSDAVSDDSLQN
jgi:hypothetical protein